MSSSANDLSDYGLDIAFVRRPEGGVDEYWYCEVGWSGLDEETPAIPSATDLYICMFSMCDVPVPVPDTRVELFEPLRVQSGSGLRLWLPDLRGGGGVVRVYDVAGRVVVTQPVPTGRRTLRLSPATSGVYFIDLRTAAADRWTGRGVVIR